MFSLDEREVVGFDKIERNLSKCSFLMAQSFVGIGILILLLKKQMIV